MSCRKATSPISEAVGAPVASATPTADDVTPSIPLAPRLASTRTPLRGSPNHSRSRTGMDDDVNRLAPSGNAASTDRATPGSVTSG